MSNQSHTTTTTSPSNPLRIIIRPYPFNSIIAHNLITALDDELAEMYPDWDDLTHPGFQEGKVGGDPLTQDNTDLNPAHTFTKEGYAASNKMWEDRDLPVLTAFDADDTVPSTSIVSLSTTNDKPIPESMQDLTSDQVHNIHYHVAFDVTDLHLHLPSPADTASPSDPSSLPTSTLARYAPAIGCIGLKLMPYFPDHRVPTQSTTTTTTNTNTSTPPQRTAEIKRVYIRPSYRGKLTTLSHPQPHGQSHPHNQTQTQSQPHPQRLITALLSTATTYAHKTLHVERLVLETGVRQHAAIKVYERTGWRKRELFGDYVGAGAGDGGVSACYELDLT